MKMIYKSESKKFVCIASYDERMIAKNARFRWDPGQKQWWTDDPTKAITLLEYADETALPILKQADETRQESIQASTALDANLDIPVPPGLSYFPFQKAGIQYAVQRKNTLIADDMGVGKTVEAIGVINYLDLKKVLVVCPASLKINWYRELTKWLVQARTVGIINGNKFFDADIVIINYDILVKYQKKLESFDWDLIIVDEAHYVKNYKAFRSKALYSIAKKASRKIYMTGTPIVNRPSELYPIISSLGAPVARNFWEYMKRYCNAIQTKWGWDMTGAAHLEELQEKLRESIMIRRMKSEVLTELPSKMRQIIEIGPAGLTEQIRKEKTFMNSYESGLEDFQKQKKFAQESENEEAYREAVEQLRAFTQAAFTEIAKLRHETALLKVPHVIEHINHVLENEEKVLVFAHHHDVVDEIYAAFKDIAVTLTGRDSQTARQSSVDAFQDGDAKVFIGSIQAAAEGLTLTAANTVVFAELDWTPAKLSQAEDRTHRIGQKKAVLVQHLVIDGSIDAMLAKTVSSKQEIIEQAMNSDKMEAEEIDFSTAGALIEEVIEEAKEIPKKKIFNQEEMTALQEAVSYLAAVCDYAASEDNRGFNKIDAHIGHSFAEKGIHTDKQAALAKRIVKKYHRQLDPALFEQIYGE